MVTPERSQCPCGPGTNALKAPAKAARALGTATILSGKGSEV